jgi:hypothetical protein
LLVLAESFRQGLQNDEAATVYFGGNGLDVPVVAIGVGFGPDI